MEAVTLRRGGAAARRGLHSLSVARRLPGGADVWLVDCNGSTVDTCFSLPGSLWPGEEPPARTSPSAGQELRPLHPIMLAP